MIKAEVLDAMLETGCSAEQIVAAVKASMGARSSGAERQARYRDAKKAREEASHTETSDVTLRNGGGRDVTDRNDVTDGSSLSPVPPSFPPYPPNNPLTPKPFQKNNSRGTRLPDDWQLTGPDLAYALSKGLTEAETGDLAERFKSWALSASGPNAVKRNWHQAFQGWVQREGPKIIAARAGPRAFTAKPLTAYQQKQQETKDILDDLDNFARNGSSSREANTRLLRDDTGERSEGIRGRPGADAFDFSAERC